MYVITPSLYATSVSGTLNYAVYSRFPNTNHRARRIGTVKRMYGTKFAYFPSGTKRHGEVFDTLQRCLESLK